MTYYNVTLLCYDDADNDFFEFRRLKDAEITYSYLLKTGVPEKHISIEMTAQRGSERRTIKKHVFGQI